MQYIPNDLTYCTVLNFSGSLISRTFNQQKILTCSVQCACAANSKIISTKPSKTILENLALYCIFMVNSVYMLEGQIVLPTRDILAEISINPMKTKPNSFLRPCTSLEFGNFSTVLAKYEAKRISTICLKILFL